MTLAATFQPQIRILHAAVNLTSKGGAKKRAQAKGGAADAPLVVQRRFMRGDDAAAAPHEVANLAALAIGKRRDVGEDQCLKMAEMSGVQKAVVHHLKWNARLNQR